MTERSIDLTGIFGGTGIYTSYNAPAPAQVSPSSSGIKSTNEVEGFLTNVGKGAVSNFMKGATVSGALKTSLITTAGAYGGGKVANELFDNKGYSDAGGQIGGAIGATAGPVGFVAGSVIGSTIGSLFGGGGEDYRFRTYSGELGANSKLNEDQLAEKKADWDSINIGGKIGGHYAYTSGARYGQSLMSRYYKSKGIANPNAIDVSPEGEKERSSSYDRWVGSGDYSKNTSSAYKWLKEGNTFAIGDKYAGPGGDYSKAIDKDWASVTTAFGRYTVGHIDDIPGRTNFAEGWVDSIGKLDAAVASILTEDQIALSKDGLQGSIQGTPDWHNTSGQNYATDAMIFDRYTAIFELAGRDDLAEQLVKGMDRSISGTAKYTAAGGEGGRARVIPLLAEILQNEKRSTAGTGIMARTKTPRKSKKKVRASRRYPKMTKPEGIINPAMSINYV